MYKPLWVMLFDTVSNVLFCHLIQDMTEYKLKDVPVFKKLMTPSKFNTDSVCIYTSSCATHNLLAIFNHFFYIPIISLLLISLSCIQDSYNELYDINLLSIYCTYA